MRGRIGRIVLTPVDDTLQVEMTGDLALTSQAYIKEIPGSRCFRGLTS